MNSKTRHTVIPRTMCFIFYQDELLLIKASDQKDWAGIYDPVGGHIELGEDIIDSANREIKEETGLDVTDTRLRGIVHVTNFFGKNIMMFVTTSNTASKEINASHKEGELEWVHLNQLDSLNIHADVKPILERIKSHPTGVFTAISTFNHTGQLIKLTFGS